MNWTNPIDAMAAIVAEADERDTSAFEIEIDGWIATASSHGTWTEEDELPFLALWDRLQEASAMKTDGGMKFPPAAYAYVPDSEKPSGWKIRLWETPEKKVTRKQVGAASAAFSPGGFRGQRVQLPSGDVAKVKAKVRAAYRSLGVVDKDIPKWIREIENMERDLLASIEPLQEAKYDSDKGIVTIRIIKPGFNKDKSKYYPSEVLERDADKAFKGLKMFADHPTRDDERQRPERSVRDWVGNLTEVWRQPDGSIWGKAVIIQDWLKEKLRGLRDTNLLEQMGVSIVALAQLVKGQVEGENTAIVESIIQGRSVDFVTYPGAGGQVLAYESLSREHDVGLVSVAELREARPDLLEDIEGAIKTQILSEATKDMDELKEARDTIEERDKAIKESQEVLEGKDKELGALKEANEKLTADAARAVAQVTIKEAVAKAKLPDASKARILETHKDATTAEGIDKAIEGEAKYLATLTEGGATIKGLGDTETVETKEADEARKTLVDTYKDGYLRQGHSDETAQALAESAARGR